MLERLSILALSVSLGASLFLSALCVVPPALAQEPRQEQTAPQERGALPDASDDLLAELESIYKDIHANPELAFQETRTAGIAADPQAYAKAAQAGRVNELPSNHSPPVIDPTLRVGIEAMLAAAGPWLARVGAQARQR